MREFSLQKSGGKVLNTQKKLNKSPEKISTASPSTSFTPPPPTNTALLNMGDFLGLLSWAQFSLANEYELLLGQQ